MPQKINSHGKLQEYNTKDGQYTKTQRADWNKKHGFGKHTITPEVKASIIKFVEHLRSKAKAKTQDTHLEKWTEPPSLVEQMKNYLGVSEAEAIELTDALSKWTDRAYSEIRKAQNNSDTSSEYFRTAMLLETYIQKAPKWTGKPIYRGLTLTQGKINECKIGGVFKMYGVSSWSSEKNVAEKFAKRNKKPYEKEVILINHKGTTQGTSVSHLEQYKDQYEILVSNYAKHIVKKKYKVGNRTIIEVEEKRK